MPAKLEITGEIARIILSGDLDFSTQGNLGDAIDQALSIEFTKEIHVDMTDVTFIRFLRHSSAVETSRNCHRTR